MSDLTDQFTRIKVHMLFLISKIAFFHVVNTCLTSSITSLSQIPS